LLFIHVSEINGLPRISLREGVMSGALEKSLKKLIVNLLVEKYLAFMEP
jgi:hypothetical protein